MSDIIAAVATARGRAALGIIRLSGEGAVALAEAVFRPQKGGLLRDFGPHRLVLGEAVDEEGRVLDQVLCTYALGPRSFTGEDTAEFQCHGSPAALQELLHTLLRQGARMALPGEFSRRAFLNGRLDLSQAEAIMDLSSHGNTQPFRQKLIAECPAMIGTVPVYDSVIHYQRDLATLTAKDFIDVVRLHAQDGVDFVTLHCGITRKTIDQIKKHKRKMNIVSRGGSLVFAWMSMTGEENPFYEYYDEILEICREYDVTISLGDACRPGCLADASDVCQIEELVRLGELTKRAWARDVQVMVEGPGHMPMDQIAANMKIQQTICMGAPFYVLGPLVTDIAPGYDHITSAIGGAIAAMSGAAFLCYVTPAEHLALPNVEDVKQGIIASKIAAHAADIAKHIPHARDLDDALADARRTFDWEGQWAVSIDPETAKGIRDSRAPEHEDTCSMCGKFCAVRSMNKALSGEHIDIL